MQVIPAWEAEHGLAFTVNGSRYLDELAATMAPVRMPRSKTPAPGDRAKTPAPGDRARTPGPGERSKTPGPGDRARTPALQPASTVRPVRAQHTGGASIGVKRQQTGNGLSTPASSWSDSSVKRPRTQSVSASKVPMPASWGLPAEQQQPVARTTFRPRPSAVSTASSIFSSRTVSSATSIDSIDAKPA